MSSVACACRHVERRVFFSRRTTAVMGICLMCMLLGVRTETVPVSVHLTPQRINALAQQTAKRLHPLAVRFQPLKTRLTLCRSLSLITVPGAFLRQPLFVVGEDAVPYASLKRYRPLLEKKRAMGLVIQATRMDALARLRAVSGSLPLSLAKGEAVIQRWGIPCYPVLIEPTQGAQK